MKCEICGKEILRDSQCINYKYYHNDCIENLLQENKKIKMINEEYERLNKEKYRGFKIIDVQEYDRYELLSYKNYKDNWNKLKEIAKSQSGFKKRADLKGGLWFEVDDLLDKMHELEQGSDSNE